jgi:hypothetical protein
MAKEAAQKLWIRPELKRLGEIKDVAGPNPNGPEGGSTKS